MKRIIWNEYQILKNIEANMYYATNVDTINKVYRQGRVWARYQHYYGYGMSYEKYRWIIEKLKQYKRCAKKALY